MNANKQTLQKLILAARKAHTPQAPLATQEAPLGFSTRVAAHWAATRERSSWGDLWERLCWWGASASLAVCLLAFVNHSLQPDPNPFDVLLEAQANDADLQ